MLRPVRMSHTRPALQHEHMWLYYEVSTGHRLACPPDVLYLLHLSSGFARQKTFLWRLASFEVAGIHMQASTTPQPKQLLHEQNNTVACRDAWVCSTDKYHCGKASLHSSGTPSVLASSLPEDT